MQVSDVKPNLDRWKTCLKDGGRKVQLFPCKLETCIHLDGR